MSHQESGRQWDMRLRRQSCPEISAAAPFHLHPRIGPCEVRSAIHASDAEYAPPPRTTSRFSSRHQRPSVTRMTPSHRRSAAMSGPPIKGVAYVLAPTKTGRVVLKSSTPSTPASHALVTTKRVAFCYPLTESIDDALKGRPLLAISPVPRNVTLPKPILRNPLRSHARSNPRPPPPAPPPRTHRSSTALHRLQRDAAAGAIVVDAAARHPSHRQPDPRLTPRLAPVPDYGYSYGYGDPGDLLERMYVDRQLDELNAAFGRFGMTAPIRLVAG